MPELPAQVSQFGHPAQHSSYNSGSAIQQQIIGGTNSSAGAKVSNASHQILSASIKEQSAGDFNNNFYAFGSESRNEAAAVEIAGMNKEEDIQPKESSEIEKVSSSSVDSTVKVDQIFPLIDGRLKHVLEKQVKKQLLPIVRQELMKEVTEQHAKMT